MTARVSSVPRRYYSETRSDLVALVEGCGNRVLEIGCGVGQTGAALKRAGKAAEVVGVERVSEIAREAATRLDRVLNVDIECDTLALADGYFDYILAGDVLEHLRDPWETVERLAACLKQGGHFIASVPNVRHWRVIRDLVLKGKWQYEANGVLDRTHLRFFTKRSIPGLFDTGTFAVSRLVPRFRFCPKSKSNIANRLTLGFFEAFLAFQYVVVARRI